MATSRPRGLLLVLSAVLALAACGTTSAQHSAPTASASSGSTPGSARGSTPGSDLATVRQARLPAPARRTLALIDAGGPYPYRRDGSVFGNREHRLPSRPDGYYHEYTVSGSRSRGARRLVAGGRGDVYYTADHHGSFRQVLRP